MKIFTISKTMLIIAGTAVLLWFSACIEQPEPVETIIGISKGAPLEYYGNYSEWLHYADSNIITMDLYHMPVDSALKVLEQCSGLLLSGGPDIYPGRYGKEEDTVKCDPPDLFRDSLEFALIGRARELQLPIMGICRGLQIFNVYHGGSLYADLPVDLDTIVKHRCEGTYDCFHEISVAEGSELHNTAGKKQGMVNSNHHQGIHRLAEGLEAIARTNDGLIESIEYKDKETMPFFLGVQWHPERMDIQNPFSLPLAMYFIQEAKLYSMRHVESQ